MTMQLIEIRLIDVIVVIANLQDFWVFKVVHFESFDLLKDFILRFLERVCSLLISGRSIRRYMLLKFLLSERVRMSMVFVHASIIVSVCVTKTLHTMFLIVANLPSIIQCGLIRLGHALVIVSLL